MPIFEYKCGKCKHVFDVLQTKSKKSEKCEKCGAKALKLPASRVGFVFKGSGFYVNDYKSAGASPAASTTVSPEKKSETAPAKAEKAEKPPVKQEKAKESKSAK